MVRTQDNGGAFSVPKPKRLIYANELHLESFPFQHGFAIHLLLHGRPLKIVSQLLGHKSIESTYIYTNVLTADGGYPLGVVDYL